jgi:hypothetical protein
LPGHDIELAQEAADDLVGISLGAQAIELRHDADKRLLDVTDRTFRVVLALLLEAALALDEFFPVEIGKRMKNGLALGARVGQEAR